MTLPKDPCANHNASAAPRHGICAGRTAKAPTGSEEGEEGALKREMV